MKLKDDVEVEAINERFGSGLASDKDAENPEVNLLHDDSHGDVHHDNNPSSN